MILDVPTDEVRESVLSRSVGRVLVDAYAADLPILARAPISGGVSVTVRGASAHRAAACGLTVRLP